MARFSVKQFSIVYLDSGLTVLGTYSLGGHTSHDDRVEFALSKGIEDFKYYLFVHDEHLLDHYYGFDRGCNYQIDFDLNSLEILSKREVKKG